MGKRQIDARLFQVASYVRENAVFADIGCDHGYLSIHLMEHRNAIRGFACDIRPAPLSKAKNNLIGAGLADKVEVILTDGLTGLEKKGLTDIVIAGMGGEIIAGILGKAPFIKDESLRLVLQPMSRDAILRTYLYQEGFAIKDESAVQSGKYVYTIMLVEYTGTKVEIDSYFANVGLLPTKTGDAVKEKLRRTEKYLRECAEGLSRKPGREQEGKELTAVADRIRKECL